MLFLYNNVGWSLLCRDQPKCAEKQRAAALYSVAKEKSRTIRDFLDLQPARKKKRKKKKGGKLIFQLELEH
jgi:hypothetical protein